MNIEEKEKLAKAWIMYHSNAESPGVERYFWAYDALCDMCINSPSDCWEMIGVIKDIDSSDLIIANLAAGPLEDLLCNSGDLVIESIEQGAESDPTIKKMLGAVWQNAIPDHIWTRVQAIADPSW